MAATTHQLVAADFPRYGTVRDQLGHAVKRAIQAAAPTHWPPWHIEVFDHFAELSAPYPPARFPNDASERAALLQGGMALQYLKLALKQQGCFGRVELFPDLDQPTLAARVHPGSSGFREAQEQQLAAALDTTDPQTTSFVAATSDQMLEALSRPQPGERVWLELARSTTSRQQLLDLLRGVDGSDLGKLPFTTETLARTALDGWESTGTTLPTRFARWRKAALPGKAPLTLPPRNPITDTDFTPPHGTLAVLKTKTDDKHGWLAAGQMLARLRLLARVGRVTCTPFWEVLQSPERRAQWRTSIGHKGFTQVIVGFAGLTLPPPASVSTHFATTATASSS